MLMQWIVEMPDEAQAAALADDVAGGSVEDGRFSTGVSSGRLFALLVTGSSAVGVTPFESPATLAQLADATRTELEHAVQSTR